MEVDRIIKEKVMQWLSTYPNVTDITNTSDYDPMCPVDITYCSGGTKCAIEVKGRKIPSTKYGDNMIQIHKLIDCQNLVNEGKFDYIYVISTFTDGCMLINSIWDAYNVENHFLPRTTEFDNHTKKKDWTVSFIKSLKREIGS